MSRGEIRTVAIDASVLINLAIVDRLEPLGALDPLRFVVPLETLGEVERPSQRERIDRAIEEGHLEQLTLTEPSVLARRARLLADLDPGEAACLAAAVE